jgi:hypothetical protein
MAVNFINLLFYTIASVLSVVLAVLILIFHTVGNERARAMVMKVCGCFKKKKKAGDTLAPPIKAPIKVDAPKGVKTPMKGNGVNKTDVKEPEKAPVKTHGGDTKDDKKNGKDG